MRRELVREENIVYYEGWNWLRKEGRSGKERRTESLEVYVRLRKRKMGMRVREG